MKVLLDTNPDPEVQPGLFQGDMALTNEMYEFWRVGLRWEVMPDRKWLNNTVPYVISPLYGVLRYTGYIRRLSGAAAKSTNSL